MAYIGGASPFPFEIGGGPSTAFQYYLSLRDAVGIGGAAADGTIEADWRLSQARGIRAAFCEDRAVYQGWPWTVTDYLSAYEEMLYLNPGMLSDHERREQIIERWAGNMDATGPGLEDDLQRIDPLFSIVDVDRDTSVTTVIGRGFEDGTPAAGNACGPAFGGGRKHTSYPNFSKEFWVIIRFAVDTGLPSPAAFQKIETAKVLLDETLPCWVDWQIFTAAAGFHLDIDSLDITAFSP